MAYVNGVVHENTASPPPPFLSSIPSLFFLKLLSHHCCPIPSSLPLSSFHRHQVSRSHSCLLFIHIYFSSSLSVSFLIFSSCSSHNFLLLLLTHVTTAIFSSLSSFFILLRLRFFYHFLLVSFSLSHCSRFQFYSFFISGFPLSMILEFLLLFSLFILLLLPFLIFVIFLLFLFSFSFDFCTSFSHSISLSSSHYSFFILSFFSF